VRTGSSSTPESHFTKLPEESLVKKGLDTIARSAVEVLCSSSAHPGAC